MSQSRSCGSYGPGHLVHWVQAKKARELDEYVRVKVLAVHDGHDHDYRHVADFPIGYRAMQNSTAHMVPAPVRQPRSRAGAAGADDDHVDIEGDDLNLTMGHHDAEALRSVMRFGGRAEWYPQVPTAVCHFGRHVPSRIPGPGAVVCAPGASAAW